MSFDTLAPHYRWMEVVLAGRKLQRCRTAFLDRACAARCALILGEGNGRFLTELLRVNPQVQVTCVDASRLMLEQTRKRLERNQLPINSVKFVCADIEVWPEPRSQFDLIATHFFLDCFRADQLEAIVAKLTGSAVPGARWLLSDFCEPERPGLARLRARMILRSMYFFFRVATSLPASRVTRPDELLKGHGFQLAERSVSEWGLLHSDLWVRP